MTTLAWGGRGGGGGWQLCGPRWIYYDKQRDILLLPICANDQLVQQPEWWGDPKDPSELNGGSLEKSNFMSEEKGFP